MAVSADLVQSRKWMITINNPLDHGFDHEAIKAIMSKVRGASLYWCMCDEEGDECETLHTHIFLYRSSPFSAKTLSNMFPDMHRDICYGTPEEIRDYVLKNGDRFGKQENGHYDYTDAKGKRHVGINFSDTFEEFGDCPEEHQGKSNASEITGVIKSSDKSYTLQPTSDMTVLAVFESPSTPAWFLANGTYWTDDLNDAVSVANSGTNKTVIQMSNGILPAGSYTIASGVTLLIPFNETYTLYTSEPEATESSFVTPTAYRTLTMANGAKIVVNGAMSVSGKHCAKMGSNGLPSGPQGFVVMEKGSSITVNSGGNLYAWGYIVGEKRSANTETPKGGAVTIKNGGTIYECFQVTDYRGGDATSNMASSYGDNIKTYRVFPMSQYYIQNVQVPMTLEAGAAEIGYMSVTVTLLGVQSAPVPFIGSNGLFRIGSGSITKDYDEQNDRLVIDINGDLTMSTMTINIKVGAIGTVDLDSSQYVLPMAGNMTVNLNSGSTVTLTQDLALIPGGVLNIAEGATLNVGTSSKSQNLYVYDKEQWGGYCYSSSVTYRPLDYAYDRFAKRTEASLVDAKILVNGTLDSTCGYVYTTSGGANICSTGTGMFKVGTLGTQTVTYQAAQADTTVSYAEISIAPAQLHNGQKANCTYVSTTSAASATTYYYCADCEMWATDDDAVAHIINANGYFAGHYGTLQTAVTDYETGVYTGGYVQMCDISTAACSISGTVCLDLKGHDVSGVTLTGTLCGADSATNGFAAGTGDKAPGTLTLAGTPAMAATVNGKGYAAVPVDGGYQFHRFAVTPSACRYYYNANAHSHLAVQATIQGTAEAMNLLSDVGFEVTSTVSNAGGGSGWYTEDTGKTLDKTALETVSLVALDFVNNANIDTEYTVTAKAKFTTGGILSETAPTTISLNKVRNLPAVETEGG